MPSFNGPPILHEGGFEALSLVSDLGSHPAKRDHRSLLDTKSTPQALGDRYSTGYADKSTKARAQ